MVTKFNGMYVLTLFALLIGLFGLLTGCEVGGMESGTVVISVSGAGAHNGFNFYGTVSSPFELVGEGDYVILNGAVEVYMKDPSTHTEVKLSGGGVYYASGYIEKYGTPGATPTDWVIDPTKSFEVDGNMTIQFTFPTDFKQL